MHNALRDNRQKHLKGESIFVGEFREKPLGGVTDGVYYSIEWCVIYKHRYVR